MVCFKNAYENAEQSFSNLSCSLRAAEGCDATCRRAWQLQHGGACRAAIAMTARRVKPKIRTSTLPDSGLTAFAKHCRLAIVVGCVKGFCPHNKGVCPFAFAWTAGGQPKEFIESKHAFCTGLWMAGLVTDLRVLKIEPLDTAGNTSNNDFRPSAGMAPKLCPGTIHT